MSLIINLLIFVLLKIKTQMKSEVIKHIIDLHKNIIPKPDASGSYYQYPVQSIFHITKGVIDLSVASRFKLTKNNFTEDKEYPTIVLTQQISKNFKYDFLVSIRVGRKYPTYFGFNNFEEANNLYLKLVYDNELTDNIYTISRYYQLVENKVNNYTYDEYINLITTDVSNI